VGRVMFKLGLVLLGLAFFLIGIATYNTAEHGLSSTGGRVDVGLESRGVLVGHFDDCVVDLVNASV
jgi:hypothetical protein